jgi:hypothetical protein
MRKLLIITLVTASTFSYVGCLVGRQGNPTGSAVVNDGRIILIPTDSVDGRPTYSVLLPDGTAMDGMYPEEIALSLNEGVWQYNETLTLTDNQ